MSARNGALRPFQPRRFGRFTLLAPLAAGGMGQIYLARARFAGGLEKLCVIKKVLPELARDPDFAARFREEAQTLIRLQHGSIAQVYDTGEEEGEWWIAMEFVDGKDLRRLLQRLRSRGERMPLPVALFVSTKILEALGYAHRKKDDDGREMGLVHRDVSPQNVLLSYEGEVKVIDFGLARSTISAPEVDPSVVMGKFHYMAPEQARNLTVDRRADLYAVGVILYEAITGWNPFEDAPPGEVVEWAASPRIPPVQRLVPTLPDAIADALRTALAIDPEQRFASAEEMRACLASCLSEIAPGVGPEQLGALLQSEFAEEYERERAWIASLGSSLRESSAAADEVTRAAPVPRPGSGSARVHSAAGKATSADHRERAASAIASKATERRTPAAPRVAEIVPWDRERSAGAAALRSAAAAASSVPRSVPWYERPSLRSEPIPPPEPTPVPPLPVPRTEVEIELAVQAAPAFEEIPAADTGTPAQARSGGWRRGAIAALVVVAIGAGTWLLRPSPTPSPEPAPAATIVRGHAEPIPSPPEPPQPSFEPPPVEATVAVQPPPAPEDETPPPTPAPEPARPVVARPAAPKPPATVQAPPRDARAEILDRHRIVMRKYERLVAVHGVDQVGGILAGLVRATDSQIKRLIDEPAHHEELRRRLDELDRLLEERRRAFER